DIVAGTSSGAINSSILTSYVIENKTWKGSAENLIKFWKHISSTPNLSNWWPFSFDDKSWKDTWQERYDYNNIEATGEAARRYYSAKEYLYSGAPNVFSKPEVKYDNKFFDEIYPPQNLWYKYDNQPLKKSIESFILYPIKTIYNDNVKQPRLLLISVDVQDGTSVVFDSYPKDKDGNIRMSQFKSENLDEEESDDKSVVKTIKYNEGIKSEHIIASASVPINYDYTKLDAEIGPATTTTTTTTATRGVMEKDGVTKIKSDMDINNNKATRYFWDGGILSNTPLRELIQQHREYWLKVQKKQTVPNLNLYIVDVHPSRNDNIYLDRDGVINRNLDIVYHNRNLYDIKVANIVSDYIDLANKLIEFAKQNGIKEEEINREILNKPTKQSKSRSGDERKYSALLEGRFNIEKVTHLERKNDANSISNKAFDFSTQTINQLIEDGKKETTDYLNSQKNLSG
ncbi:MAG: patatin-like phospholipase family protein, partial [Candidatus Nitrosocosmicus sp.]